MLDTWFFSALRLFTTPPPQSPPKKFSGNMIMVQDVVTALAPSSSTMMIDLDDEDLGTLMHLQRRRLGPTYSTCQGSRTVRVRPWLILGGLVQEAGPARSDLKSYDDIKLCHMIARARGSPDITDHGKQLRQLLYKETAWQPRQIVRCGIEQAIINITINIDPNPYLTLITSSRTLVWLPQARTCLSAT